MHLAVESGEVFLSILLLHVRKYVAYPRPVRIRDRSLFIASGVGFGGVWLCHVSPIRLCNILMIPIPPPFLISGQFPMVPFYSL